MECQGVFPPKTHSERSSNMEPEVISGPGRRVSVETGAISLVGSMFMEGTCGVARSSDLHHAPLEHE